MRVIGVLVICALRARYWYIGILVHAKGMTMKQNIPKKILKDKTESFVQNDVSPKPKMAPKRHYLGFFAHRSLDRNAILELIGDKGLGYGCI